MSGTVSAAHREYLRRRVRRRAAVQLARWAVLVAAVGAWEAAARWRLVDPFITSQPSRIWQSLVRLAAGGELWMHLGVTVAETAAGFLLGTLLGIGIAVVLWWSPFWSDVAEPYIVMLNSIPKVALGPIFIVWLGTNVKAVLAMAVAISVIVTVLMMFSAFREVDRHKITLLKTFGATKAQILAKVVLPATVPTMIASLKVNVGLSLVGTIVGEFLGSKAGLGYLIIYGGQVFNMSLVMAAVILLALVSIVLYYLVSYLEARVTRGR